MSEWYCLCGEALPSAQANCPKCAPGYSQTYAQQMHTALIQIQLLALRAISSPEPIASRDLSEADSQILG